MAALLIGGEKVTQLINRCTIYELLYLSSDVSGPFTLAMENLTTALTALYLAVLRFLARAKKEYDKGYVSRTLGSVLSSKVLEFVENCNALETQVDTEAKNLDRIQGRGANMKLESLLKDLKNPILRIDARVGALSDKYEVDKQCKILSWISDIPYKEIHNVSREGWTKGTGNWLLEHDQYVKWRASSASTILWLHGMRKCIYNI